MEQFVREILEQYDDPKNAEYPPGFVWSSFHDRLMALQPELERIADRPFVLDDQVQDASFFADLSIQRSGSQPNLIDTVFAIRFSNFGGLPQPGVTVRSSNSRTPPLRNWLRGSSGRGSVSCRQRRWTSPTRASIRNSRAPSGG